MEHIFPSTSCILQFCLLVVILLPLTLIRGEYCEKINCERNGKKEKVGKPKTILYWTHFYGHYDFEFGFGQGPFIEAGCRVNNCWATADKALSHEADALLFHMRNVNDRTPLPVGRRADQRFVFFLMEHPFNQWNDLRQWGSFFNLTMTYRLDSDVRVLYGRTVRMKDNLQSTSQFIKAKELKKGRKPIAWFVSNCNSASKREEYVRELQKYIPVDVYGNCGPLQCPMNNMRHDKRMDPSCYQMLEETYDFYLSFENIHCVDYVTEKLFNILDLDTVPVVMGGADYARLTPPKSVINIDQFDTPRDLAVYLEHLQKSPKEYWGYKNWRRTHRIVGPGKAYKEAFCQLCELLNDPTYPVKQYDDLHHWWAKDLACDRQVFQKMKKKWP